MLQIPKKYPGNFLSETSYYFDNKVLFSDNFVCYFFGTIEYHATSEALCVIIREAGAIFAKFGPIMVFLENK